MNTWSRLRETEGWSGRELSSPAFPDLLALGSWTSRFLLLSFGFLFSKTWINNTFLDIRITKINVHSLASATQEQPQRWYDFFCYC